MHGIQLCFRGWLHMAQDRAVQPRVVVLVWSTVLKGLNPTEGPASTVMQLPYSFKFTKYARVKYILTSCLCICLNTLTGRYTPRPISCSLTSASTVSHQVVACVTTVGGCLSKSCSSSVTNLAIGWISQTAAVNCQDEEYIM